MLLVSGGILGLNLREHVEPMMTACSEPEVVDLQRARAFNAKYPEAELEGEQTTSFGWPFHFISVMRWYHAGETSWTFHNEVWIWYEYERKYLVEDAAVWVVLLIGLAVGAEVITWSKSRVRA